MLDALLAQLPVAQPSAVYAPLFVCMRWSFTFNDKTPFSPTVWCVKWEKQEPEKPPEKPK